MIANQTPKVRLNVEALEERAVPATVVMGSLSTNGTLTIEGTNSSDVIVVRESGGRITIDNASIAYNGQWYSAANASAVRSIVVYGLNGNDHIRAEVSNVAMTANGNAGNDTIYGGNRNDTLWGGAGADRLYGRNGSDFLSGAGGTGNLVGERDLFDGGTGFDTFGDLFDGNRPVTAGIYVDDIKQGELNTCQTLASLASGARTGIDFSQMIRRLNDSTYAVTLFGGYGTQTVSFSGVWTDNDPMPTFGQAEFWVILMQRARLQAIGVNPYTTYTPAQQQALFNVPGYGDPGAALQAFTGNVAQRHAVNTLANNPAGLQNVVRGGYRVVAGSNLNGTDSAVNNIGIAYAHAYSVMDVYYDNGWKVKLHNPWGTDSINGYTIDNLSGAAASNDGFITVSWSEFVSTANFSYVFIA